jgi:formyl-CoA transferase
LLGDLGADILKVEQPGHGDDTRAWGPPYAGGESGYYLSVNRNKRSLTVDLKHPAGQDIIRTLARESDVVVENFKLGTLDRLGLGYAQLSELNPRLIWANISGYGPDGPDADRPGYDFVVQGEAGLMAITGEPDGEPMKVGVAVVDVTTGMYTAIAILAALRARDAHGVGQRIDSSLLTSAVSWLANVGQNHLITGRPAKRFGNAHANIVPYQSFHARDQYITVGVGNDRQFQSFCAVLGLPDLPDDARFATNPARVEHRDELIAQLQAVIERRDAADLLAACRAAGVPSGSINSVEQVFADPQVLAREMVVEIEHPTAGALRMAGIPYAMSGTPASVRLPPPLLGQHTDEILRERLGLSPERIAALHASGAV